MGSWRSDACGAKGPAALKCGWRAFRSAEVPSLGRIGASSKLHSEASIISERRSPLVAGRKGSLKRAFSQATQTDEDDFVLSEVFSVVMATELGSSTADCLDWAIRMNRMTLSRIQRAERLSDFPLSSGCGGHDANCALQSSANFPLETILRIAHFQNKKNQLLSVCFLGQKANSLF
ncbi:hypothetical protein TcG_09925 [Trypanosoma cruzi]|nr:hypothetical protein TcG_09925 [Trypanosoma cruzi]